MERREATVSEGRRLGPLDAFFERACYRAADGRWLVYPWGARGHGAVLPSEAHARRVRRDLRAAAALAWLATPLVAALTMESCGPLPTAAFAFASGLGSFARLLATLRGLPRTDAPYRTPAERRRSGVDRRG
jgi:hypothetical protein